MSYDLLLLKTKSNKQFRIRMGSKQKDLNESKILCSILMQYMEKWFGRWDAIHFYHYFSINEVILQWQCIMT